MLKADWYSDYAMLCKSIDSPYAHQVLAAEKRGLATFLKEKAPRPGDYHDAVSFSEDWLIANVLKKSPLLPGHTESSRATRAFNGWKAAEARCASTNRSISEIISGSSRVPGIRIGGESSVAQIILSAQRKVRKVLGETVPVDAVLAGCRWSNGATALKKRGTTVGEKVSDKPSVTLGAYRLAAYALSEDYVWLRSFGIDAVGPCTPLKQCFTILDSNRMCMVPKNAYTHRVICAEAEMNAFLQQGVGAFIRKNLKRVGVDLNDQSWNQRLARIAQDASLSTLDLESASDTICIMLVKLLLPEQWFTLVDALRAKSTVFNGTTYALEKFSSMGNAYTFELESLLFWAISESVVEATSTSRLIAIYGDDIIVPQESADSVQLVLDLLGFKTNVEKTFKTGRFFESCGEHYFDGVNVTPIYFKSQLSAVHELVRAHNALLRWSLRNTGTLMDKRISKWARALRKHAGPNPPAVPLGDGDDGFITSLAAFVRSEQDGYRCSLLICKTTAKAREVFEEGHLAYKLRKPAYSNVTPKGHVGTVRSKWVLKQAWVPHWRVDPRAT